MFVFMSSVHLSIYHLGSCSFGTEAVVRPLAPLVAWVSSLVEMWVGITFVLVPAWAMTQLLGWAGL